MPGSAPERPCLATRTRRRAVRLGCVLVKYHERYLMRRLAATRRTVRRTFEDGRAWSRTILVIDCVEALRPDSQVQRRAFTELAVQMQNYGDQQPVVLGLTSRPWDLAPSMRRRYEHHSRHADVLRRLTWPACAHRFERRLYVGPPNADERAKMLSVCLSDEWLDPDVTPAVMASAARAMERCLQAACRPLELHHTRAHTMPGCVHAYHAGTPTQTLKRLPTRWRSRLCEACAKKNGSSWYGRVHRARCQLWHSLFVTFHLGASTHALLTGQ